MALHMRVSDIDSTYPVQVNSHRFLFVSKFIAYHLHVIVICGFFRALTSCFSYFILHFWRCPDRGWRLRLTSCISDCHAVYFSAKFLLFFSCYVMIPVIFMSWITMQLRTFYKRPTFCKIR